MERKGAKAQGEARETLLDASLRRCAFAPLRFFFFDRRAIQNPRAELTDR
jgi:hypothetical protein